MDTSETVNYWTLFWCLPVATQAKIMQRYHDWFGYKFVPPNDITTTIDGKVIHWGTEKL